MARRDRRAGRRPGSRSIGRRGDDPLHALGSAWLGRDAETGAPLPQPALPGLDIAELTADPRGYGLHATLKPPFRLALSWAEAVAAAAALAAASPPSTCRRWRFATWMASSRCVKRRPARRCTRWRMLRSKCATCRAAAGEAELARRRRSGLSPRQEAMLQRWGYPLCLEEWRFHVTLTRRLTPAEKALVLPAVTDFLGAAPSRPRRVEHVVLFTQSASGQPFRVAERLTLKGPHVLERMA